MIPNGEFYEEEFVLSLRLTRCRHLRKDSTQYCLPRQPTVNHVRKSSRAAPSYLYMRPIFGVVQG